MTKKTFIFNFVLECISTYFSSEKPEILSIEGNTHLLKGSDLDLECNVTGTPTPDITFYKDGVLVTATADKRVVFPTSMSVRVKYAGVEDGGVYVCRASNAAGSQELSIQVIIQGQASWCKSTLTSRTYVTRSHLIYIYVVHIMKCMTSVFFLVKNT